MATLFDRLNRELEAFGRRAQEAFDEGKVRLELMRLRNLRDGAARKLGYVTYQRERNLEEVEQGRVDAALFKLDDLYAEIDKLEKSLAEHEPAPPPQDAAPAPAEGAEEPAAAPEA